MRSDARVIVLLACAAPVAACAIDWSSLEEIPPGPSLDASGGDDVFAPDVDAALSSDAPMQDTAPEASSDGPCGSPQLLVNEVQTDGTGGASDEFVEIYNPGICAVSLNGWSIKYSTDLASAPKEIWRGLAKDQIAAGGYVVLAGAAFTASTVIGRFGGGLNGDLAKDGGGVGLYAALASSPTDSVAWAVIMAASHPFMRPMTGPPAAQPPSTQSISRIPNGTNTNSSKADFNVTTKPTPGKLNV